jgi:hypothetical protein
VPYQVLRIATVSLDDQVVDLHAPVGNAVRQVGSGR